MTYELPTPQLRVRIVHGDHLQALKSTYSPSAEAHRCVQVADSAEGVEQLSAWLGKCERRPPLALRQKQLPSITGPLEILKPFSFRGFELGRTRLAPALPRWAWRQGKCLSWCLSHPSCRSLKGLGCRVSDEKRGQSPFQLCIAEGLDFAGIRSWAARGALASGIQSGFEHFLRTTAHEELLPGREQVSRAQGSFCESWLQEDVEANRGRNVAVGLLRGCSRVASTTTSAVQMLLRKLSGSRSCSYCSYTLSSFNDCGSCSGPSSETSAEPLWPSASAGVECSDRLPLPVSLGSESHRSHRCSTEGGAGSDRGVERGVPVLGSCCLTPAISSLLFSRSGKLIPHSDFCTKAFHARI